MDEKDALKEENTEESLSVENEFSIPQSVEVDKIIEFYKDQEESPGENAESEEKGHGLKKIINRIPFLNKYTANIAPESEEENDEEIQSLAYGLSEKGRIVLYRVISGVVSLLIIIGSFVLAYYLPGNEKIIEEHANKLRSEVEYTDLKKQHERLSNEISDLKSSNSEKENTISQINDIDNTKSELRTKISDKTYELNALNIQITEKRLAIDELDKSIASKSAPETVYSPGKYIAGKNIPVGTYLVTGSGKFMTADSSGKSKMNITLGSTAVEVTLYQDDVIKFDSKVKFTPKS